MKIGNRTRCTWQGRPGDVRAASRPLPVEPCGALASPGDDVHQLAWSIANQGSSPEHWRPQFYWGFIMCTWWPRCPAPPEVEPSCVARDPQHKSCCLPRLASRAQGPPAKQRHSHRAQHAKGLLAAAKPGKRPDLSLDKVEPFLNSCPPHRRNRSTETLICWAKVAKGNVGVPQSTQDLPNSKLFPLHSKKKGLPS